MSGAPLAEIRAALSGTPAWLVGGAVRDRLLGRPTEDLDLAVGGDPGEAVRVIRRAVPGERPAAFPLSETFGGWRIVGPDHAWQVDVLPLQGGSLETDLAARDFTINAMAEPLGEGGPPGPVERRAGGGGPGVGALVDPFGGAGDLAARRLRAVGPSAFADDPLRTLRAVRFAAELGFAVEAETASAARRHAPGLARVAPERIWSELKRVIAAPEPVAAVERMSAFGVTAVVLPELEALRGVEQSVYHHRDVHDHTLEVLDAAVRIERDPAAAGLPAHAAALRALLDEPLADGLTRGHGMRWAALLHDIAKPHTRRERLDGRGAGFPGHHTEGAVLARAILRRLRAAERVADHVAALTEHHLRLGFLVHERPLARRAVHRYLVATGPVAVDVTALTVADRLATRGRKSAPAIAAHLELADEMLGYALAARAAGPQPPLVRGDELAAALDRDPGPWLRDVLAQLEEDRYAGDIATRDEAIARARELI